MRLNEQILELVKHLSFLIDSDGEPRLQEALDSLKQYIKDDIEGITNHAGYDLADETYDRIEQIEQMVPEEQFEYSDLMGHFDEMHIVLRAMAYDDLERYGNEAVEEGEVEI